MQEVYTDAGLARLLKRWRGYLALALSLALLSLAVSILLCFFVTHENARAIMIVNILLCAFGACATLYLLLNVVSPLGRRVKYIRLLLAGARTEITGLAVEWREDLTVPPGLPMHELCFSSDGGGQLSLYYDGDAPAPDVAGERLRLTVAMQTVIGYEVLS